MAIMLYRNFYIRLFQIVILNLFSVLTTIGQNFDDWDMQLFKGFAKYFTRLFSKNLNKLHMNQYQYYNHEG